MGPLFYRKGVSLVLGLRRLIKSSGGPDFLLDVESSLRRLLGMLPANSPFCEFISSGYRVWLDVLKNGVDPLGFGGTDGAGVDGTARGSVRGNGDVPHSSRVGSSCFVLYSFATDVLTAASSRVTVLRPGSAALGDSYAYVGPLSSLADAVHPPLPESSSGAAFVFGLVSYSIPAVLPVGLLSASSSGLGCVSLSLELSDGGVGVVGGAGGISPGLLPLECIFLVLRRDDGDDDDGGVPRSPPLSYYTWSFVRSSLSRFYLSVGAGAGAGARDRDRDSVGGGARGDLRPDTPSPPHSPLRFSDLSFRLSDSVVVSDESASEDEITSLIHSVRRAFD